MRKVAYISISVVLLMLTYFITYFVLLNDKQNQVYNEIVEVSKNTNDYENFLKYQPVMHKEIELKSVITSGYLVKIYHVTADNSSQSSVVIFVQTNNHPFAAEVKDEKDQTKLIIYENGNEVFNTSKRETTKSIAYSFGVSKMGFYYYDYKQDKNDFKAELFGYNNDLILSETLSLEDVSNLSKATLLEAGYIDEYSFKERQALLDISDKNMIIFRNILIFLSIDVGFYYLLVKKKGN